MSIEKTDAAIFAELKARHPLRPPSGGLLPPPDLPPGIGLGWVPPEDDEDDLAKLWLHLAPNELLQVRVTSPEYFHYRGHWVPSVGAYRLCTAPRCPWCPLPLSEQPAGRPVASERRQRFLLAVELPRGAQRIWEFSAKASTRLQEFTGYEQAEEGTVTRTRPLRGLVLILGREGRRKNGEVFCTLHDDQDSGAATLPGPIDVPGYLAETWRRAAIKDGKHPPV